MRQKTAKIYTILIFSTVELSEEPLENLVENVKLSWPSNVNIKFRILLLQTVLFKVRIFWEGHKISEL